MLYRQLIPHSSNTKIKRLIKQNNNIFMHLTNECLIEIVNASVKNVQICNSIINK
ncbi:hypothetical protein KSF78_0008922 [Schistosoma japonicum]|nr:hypothetical protein KSF78_0008922 [Schistosoma japonicum]KAH8858510.1 hypothetical protein KSF78_0008922 [Schistosoma japonicum]